MQTQNENKNKREYRGVVRGSLVQVLRWFVVFSLIPFAFRGKKREKRDGRADPFQQDIISAMVCEGTGYTRAPLSLARHSMSAAR